MISRSSRQDIHEEIVLIGDNVTLAKRATSHGFVVDQLTPEQLKTKYGVEAAPLLVVVDPHGWVRYSGGYTNRKQGFEIQDRVIIDDLVAGMYVEPLPVYGCATSKNLQAIVDPLRIKPSTRN